MEVRGGRTTPHRRRSAGSRPLYGRSSRAPAGVRARPGRSPAILLRRAARARKRAGSAAAAAGRCRRLRLRRGAVPNPTAGRLVSCGPPLSGASSCSSSARPRRRASCRGALAATPRCEARAAGSTAASSLSCRSRPAVRAGRGRQPQEHANAPAPPASIGKGRFSNGAGRSHRSKPRRVAESDVRRPSSAVPAHGDAPLDAGTGRAERQASQRTAMARQAPAAAAPPPPPRRRRAPPGRSGPTSRP